MPYPHVKHTAGIWQCMGVGLLQVLAGAGDVERHPHHLQSELLGSLQQVPTALQGEAKGYTGLSCVSLGGQLQQQPRRDISTDETSIQVTKTVFYLTSASLIFFQTKDNSCDPSLTQCLVWSECVRLSVGNKFSFVFEMILTLHEGAGGKS